MSRFLKKDTAQVIRFGAFVDATDGFTPETGLTIAQADMQLSKNGGAFAQKNTVGNATHDTDGWYSTTLDATDTNTTGTFVLQVTVAGARPVSHEFTIVEESVYDNIFATGAVFNNVSTAEVNAEVLDVLTVDTFAELGAVPSATSTMADKLNWLFLMARNKITQTSTTQTIRDDADSGDVATASVSDDGTTFTRDEYV